VSEINDSIKSFGNDIVGVLVSYGKIIPQTTIDLFNPGIINVHPSLLPKYRGPSPIEAAIENGDSQTGISIMELTAGMDEGPIYKTSTYTLNGKETRLDLKTRLSEIGTNMLVQLLPKILDGSIKPTKQDDSEATYCKLLKKDDSWLRPDQFTADQAERIVRAHLGFPKTKLHLEGNGIVIKKAHVSNNKNTMLDILCKDNKYLTITELVAPSGKTMSAHDFLNGHS
jgi:methionyl-tRNA formyltransferase